MTRTRIAAALVAISLLPGAAGGTAGAAEAEGEVTDFSFSFEGPFGTFDQFQLQRGLQVYNAVCSGCHGLEFVAFRSLGDATGPGLPDEQVRAIAAQYQCTDPELPAGETRECLPSDRFPANDAVGAPDLSVMAKARAGFHGPYGLGINQFLYGLGGPEYIASLLLSYTGEEQEVAGNVLYGNAVFPGGWISMAPPLFGDDVDYTVYNATGESIEAVGYIPPEATVEQEALDVAAFLMWAAEPTLVERRQAGFRNLIMIAILAVLLYYTNKKLWSPIKHRQEQKERTGA